MTPRLFTRAAVAGASALLVATSLVACTNTAGADSSASADCESVTTIGFSHSVSEAEVVKSLKEYLRVKAAENGCIEMLFDSTTGNNLETQRAAIETWVTQGIDAIVVSPVDPSALEGLRTQAQEKGTKWISYALPWEGADGMAGIDSDASGTMVGEAAAEWIEEFHPDGDVSAAVTTLTPLAAVAGGRWTIPIEIIEATDVPIVSEQDCADQACGLEITESLLRQHPDLRVFVGFNDDAALGAITAFKNAGIPLDEVFIAGQDGSRGALLAVQEGTMNITAAVGLEDVADTILQVTLNAINGSGETVLATVAQPATLADPELLERLLAQFEQLG